MDYMVKGDLNGMFLVSGGTPDKREEWMGCLGAVNIATSAIFTEGAWVSGWGSSSWSGLQRARKQ